MITNLLHHHVGTSDVLYLLIAYVLPLGSAYLTRAPSALTGILTTVLATATSFVTEWYQAPDVNHYNWANALLGALAAWAIARAAHRGTWTGSKAEAKAHASGVYF